MALFVKAYGEQLPLKDELVLVPGVGVNGLVKLGMSTAEATSVKTDMRETKSYLFDHDNGELVSKEHVIEYLDLGVSADFKETDAIQYISALVNDPDPSAACFTGAVLNNTNVISVVRFTRERVVEMFGEPKEANAANRLSLYNGRVNHSWKPLESQNIEVLFYFSEGIQFEFRDNGLKRIGILSN